PRQYVTRQATMKNNTHAACTVRPNQRSWPEIFCRNTADGKYAKYCSGVNCTNVRHGSGNISSGNMWPEKKKLNSMYTNNSELTSKNQKPIMPIVASRKKPSRNEKISDVINASITSAGGQPGKYPRQM